MYDWCFYWCCKLVLRNAYLCATLQTGFAYLHLSRACVRYYMCYISMLYLYLPCVVYLHVLLYVTVVFISAICWCCVSVYISNMLMLCPTYQCCIYYIYLLAEAVSKAWGEKSQSPTLKLENSNPWGSIPIALLQSCLWKKGIYLC